MLKVVILTDTDKLVEDDFDSLLPLVACEKQKRIMRFHFKRDRNNCLLGDIITRFELCKALGLGNEALEFTTNYYEKPLVLRSPNLHFNVSHTGHYVVFAVDNESVGIDIELIQPVDLKIAERFFASDETECIMEDDQLQRFYEIWTKKESQIKWEGKGLSKPRVCFKFCAKSK